MGAATPGITSFSAEAIFFNIKIVFFALEKRGTLIKKREVIKVISNALYSFSG